MVGYINHRTNSYDYTIFKVASCLDCGRKPTRTCGEGANHIELDQSQGNQIDLLEVDTQPTPRSQFHIHLGAVHFIQSDLFPFKQKSCVRKQ